MIIDLHIHTSTGSDGALPVGEVILEAKKRSISMMSVTDHDSIAAQPEAIKLAKENGIRYVTGIELNVTFQPKQGKAISLDFLGYDYDIRNQALITKLETMRAHREWRAREILNKINFEFAQEGIPALTENALEEIRQSVDGAFGRPHLAAYLVKKGIVPSTQQAFDKYLVKCDVPKYPLSLPEAAKLIRNAGGKLILAHPNDPHGTSLQNLTKALKTQTQIIQENMLEYIDGVECWHSRHDEATAVHYYEFVKRNNLLCTGGSDCHQKPVLMGTVKIPEEAQSNLMIQFRGE
ncbi:MAG: PHP domain-containing protein [Dehalococcoidales bacterium]|nr:PHP domain-containing protein [Dehalococcoidales bacterium]